MSRVRHGATAAPRKPLFHDKLGQRGSVAVEAAIIFPLLIVLSFGIIEFSMLMRDYTATASLVRAGARTASALPKSDDLVTDTVKAMERASSALPKDSYEELWIYKANPDGYPGGGKDFLPGTCTKAADCVRFTWNENHDDFQPVTTSGWDVDNINACPGDARAQAVGVYLKAKHTWVTGLFADTTMISDRAVLKFEPITNADCD